MICGFFIDLSEAGWFFIFIDLSDEEYGLFIPPGNYPYTYTGYINLYYCMIYR